ncbi:MAG: glucose-1-phosphate thymidylyltransferase [Candidatus Aenigmatarchaeota archaeon]
MQGLILAAGESTRLRPLTLGVPKPLIYILGKTLIDYSIEKLREFKIKEIGIVIGYLGKLIKEYLETKYKEKFYFVEQKERLGIANAIYLAIENGFIKEPFVTYLSDNLFIENFDSIREELEKFDVFVVLCKVKDPYRFGVAVIEDHRIKKLVEKPKEKISEYALTGIYYFRDPDLVKKAYSYLKPSNRGEYEITELIQWFIDRGYSVGYKITEKWWKDVGTKESLLDAVRFLLDKNEIENIEEENIKGRVIIDEKAEVYGKVYGPAYIGKNVIIEKDAIIYPYTSIEENSKIISGKIQFSLIQPNVLADVKEFIITNSIIGNNSRLIAKNSLYAREISAFISAYSEIIL